MRRLQPTLREELLGWLVDPNIALLLLVGGALLIYLEFNTPGTIVPGALGTLMVLLGVFGLDLLPIRYTAVLLLVGAMVLMVLEAKFGGHGALAIAGIVCLMFGTLTLVAAPVPEMAISPWVAIAVSAAIRRDHGFSGAAGGARTTQESAARRGCAGGQPASAMEAFDAGRACAGGGRDLACRGERPVTAGRRTTARGRPRAVFAAR